MKTVFKQLTRFSLVGVIATAIHVGVAIICVSKLSMNPLIANVVAFAVATVWSFFGNWSWTFEKKTAAKVSGQRFLVLSLACFALSESIVFVSVIKLAWPMWAAMLPVMLLVPTLSFLGSKYHAFR